MGRTQEPAHHGTESVMSSNYVRIICDAERAPASQTGDWHDAASRAASNHHRYYGASALNGGERIVESRRGRRPRWLSLFGF